MATQRENLTAHGGGRSGAPEPALAKEGAPAKKATGRKTPSTKKAAPAKKADAKKGTAKKGTARKAAPAKKAAAKKTASAKKATARKAAPAKKTAPMGRTVTKPARRRTPPKRASQRAQGGDVMFFGSRSTSATLRHLAVGPTGRPPSTSRPKVPLMLRLTTPKDRKSQVLAEAQVLGLAEKLLGQLKMRLVARALQDRASQDELAASLGTSQASISRMAGLIRSNPSVLEVSPAEVIARRAVGEISDDAMMKSLIACSYTPGEFDPTGGDGYMRGTWREIETALAQGLLSDDEYEQVAREAPVEASASASH